MAKIDGWGYAVSAEAGEDEDIFVATLVAKDGAEISGDEDWAAPAMGDADSLESGMQIADAGFEPREALGGFP